MSSFFIVLGTILILIIFLSGVNSQNPFLVFFGSVLKLSFEIHEKTSTSFGVINPIVFFILHFFDFFMDKSKSVNILLSLEVLVLEFFFS